MNLKKTNVINNIIDSEAIVRVLTHLIESQWISLWVNIDDKNAANELVQLGLVVRETHEPQEHGEAPLGAWKLKHDVKTTIISGGVWALLHKLDNVYY